MVLTRIAHLAAGHLIGIDVVLGSIIRAGLHTETAAVAKGRINLNNPVFSFVKGMLGADTETFRAVTMVAGHGQIGPQVYFLDMPPVYISRCMIFIAAGHLTSPASYAEIGIKQKALSLKHPCAPS